MSGVRQRSVNEIVANRRSCAMPRPGAAAGEMTDLSVRAPRCHPTLVEQRREHGPRSVITNRGPENALGSVQFGCDRLGVGLRRRSGMSRWPLRRQLANQLGPLALDQCELIQTVLRKQIPEWRERFPNSSICRRIRRSPAVVRTRPPTMGRGFLGTERSPSRVLDLHICHPHLAPACAHALGLRGREAATD